jgi:hypothetical protein
MIRQSINFWKNPLAKKMDARVKPAHDKLALVHFSKRVARMSEATCGGIPDFAGAHPGYLPPL